VPLILGKGKQESGKGNVSLEDEKERVKRESDGRSKTVMEEKSKPKLPKDSPQLNYI
jgi:hypothetical protein